ncbi:MAG: hypothetical protein ABH841_00025 [Candidatus Nealsonbacteria bacterium]
MAEQIFRQGMPQIIKWTIKYSGGLVKNEKQASYVVFGFAILVIIISLCLVFSGRNRSSNLEDFAPAAEASPEEINSGN